MEDKRIIAIREKIFEEFALAEDSLESAILLHESEKYRTSIPLFRDAILRGTRALLMIHHDDLPDDPLLLDLYNQTEMSKEIGLDIELTEIIKKLKKAEQDSKDHPLKISEETIKNLDVCYKQAENFLAKAHKLIKKSLLTSQEAKKRKFTKKIAVAVSVALVGAFVLVMVIRSLLALGYGLKGEYFADQNLDRLIETRRDKNIDFDWALGDLIHNHADNVSIRWTGKVKTPKSGIYRFITRSDDGVRVWIDDTLVIDDWNIHAVKEHGGEINLEKGYHRIIAEYFEGEGFASMQLLWIIPGGQRQKVIPPSNLRPE